jgi:hypothetical protein
VVNNNNNDPEYEPEEETNNKNNDPKAVRNNEPTTPKKVKKKIVCEHVLTPEHPCRYPTNHRWEEIVSGNWVLKGVLSGGKHCIGQKGDWICNKKFVANRLDNGKDESETEYHPSTKTPAYGCTQCFHAMCAKCRHHYDANQRSSPKKRSARKLVIPV